MHKICRKLKHLAMEYKVTYVHTRVSVKKHISLNEKWFIVELKPENPLSMVYQAKSTGCSVKNFS